MTLESAKIFCFSETEDLPKRIRKLIDSDKVNVDFDRDLQSLFKYFKNSTYDVLIVESSACNNDLPTCLKLVKNIVATSAATKIILLVAPSEVDGAIAALKEGAYQYAKLPVKDEELKMLIETAIEMNSFIGAQKAPSNKSGNDRLGELIGSSSQMQRVYQRARQAAASSEIPVLLLGETGTGKDMVAQTIHQLSDRKEGPYVPVNLGALPSELVASELFGHEKGSFTGAVKQHKGVFESGRDGTIFLDEIEAISEKIQVSLLRLLEQKKFRRLGGKETYDTNARIIAASNANLDELVQNGYFRQDLYYRLDVFRIDLPPLHERREDISLLSNEFLSKFSQAYKKVNMKLSPECIHIFQRYDWPGNIRELKNVIQRAAIICECDEILPEHLPPKFRKSKKERPTVEFEIGTPLDKVEREMIIRALTLANDNRTRAAELLGISRRAIYNKLKKHNID
ncbi:AAA domain-containing protein [candidate division KSB1 bacterium]|nr:AAA domain-containing protein [candidate division KSB1 bacterium]